MGTLLDVGVKWRCMDCEVHQGHEKSLMGFEDLVSGPVETVRKY